MKTEKLQSLFSFGQNDHRWGALLAFLCILHKRVGKAIGTEFQKVLEANNKTAKSFRKKEFLFNLISQEENKVKAKSTKRALLASLLSLAICISMLVGSTFAWFTDSVTSANNIIQSGNLDVELYYQVEGQTDWTKVTPSTNVFKAGALWEPGYTEVVKLKVVNEGSLALKYQLGVNIVNEIGSTNVNGTEFKLSDFIKYGIVDGDQDYTRETAVAAVDATANKLNVAYKSADPIQLLPKTAQNTDNEDIVTMVVYMPTTVGNDANHAKDAAVPTINLGINLFATQATVEADSFNNQYDASAPNFLPTGVSEDDFGTNVAYVNGNFYPNLKNALAAVHGNGADENIIYLKPGADLGEVTHAHVCSNLTVYGNGAFISGGEQDFEIGFPAASSTSCEGIKDDLTLNVYNLNGAAVWGSVTATLPYDINLNFVDCKDMTKVMLLKNGSTPSYKLNISIDNCTFKGTDAYRDSAIYCQNLGTLNVSNTTFENYAVGINQNNKDGVENYTLTNCVFVDCATASNVTTQTSYAAPVRAVASAAGTVTNLTLSNCKFVYTGTETAINGDILTFQEGNAGTVNLTKN